MSENNDQPPASEAQRALRELPRSPINGQPAPGGRHKGRRNRVSATIQEAIERAIEPGQCHPQGLAGWLVERAQGSVEDRKIFAGLVAKILPAQVKAQVGGGVVVQLPWLNSRRVGATISPQTGVEDAQVVEIAMDSARDLRVTNPHDVNVNDDSRIPVRMLCEGIDQASADPHPPVEPAGGGGKEEKYTPALQPGGPSGR